MLLTIGIVIVIRIVVAIKSYNLAFIEIKLSIKFLHFAWQEIQTNRIEWLWLAIGHAKINPPNHRSRANLIGRPK